MFLTVLEYYDLLQFATVLSEADSAEASDPGPVKGFPKLPHWRISKWRNRYKCPQCEIPSHRSGGCQTDLPVREASGLRLQYKIRRWIC